MDLNTAYLNSVVDQMIVVASLLGGFSIAIVANLLTFNTTNKIFDYIFKATTLAASCFLVSVFAMTKIVKMTTEGYPKKATLIGLETANYISSISFLLGIVFLCLVIGLSGWTKSKKMGFFTTAVGLFTCLLILMTMMTIQVSV
ncbi:MAG: hypothetical protein AAGF77_04555 [Bacteroidota bacterium]